MARAYAESNRESGRHEGQINRVDPAHVLKTKKEHRPHRHVLLLVDLICNVMQPQGRVQGLRPRKR